MGDSVDDEGLSAPLDLNAYSTHEDVRGKKLRIIRFPHSSDLVPTVFFFHGAGGQAEQWIEQFQYFHKRLSMVAVDMVGHGQSEVTDEMSHYHPDSLVEDLAVVFDRYKAKRNVIVAHSYGTSLTAKLYPRIKDHVDAFVFVGPSLHLEGNHAHPVWWLPYAPNFMLDYIRMIDRRGGANSASIARMVHPSASEELKLRQLKWNAHTPSKVVRMLSTQMQGATTEEYAAIHTPVCILVGLDDKLTPPARAQAIKEALDTRTVLYPSPRTSHDGSKPSAPQPTASLPANESKETLGTSGGAKETTTTQAQGTEQIPALSSEQSMDYNKFEQCSTPPESENPSEGKGNPDQTLTKNQAGQSKISSGKELENCRDNRSHTGGATNLAPAAENGTEGGANLNTNENEESLNPQKDATLQRDADGLGAPSSDSEDEEDSSPEKSDQSETRGSNSKVNFPDEDEIAARAVDKKRNEAAVVCELHQLSNCGHQAMLEKKDIVNARINKFLIGVVGFNTLDRLHWLNRGDSVSDKWALKNYEKWARTQAYGKPIRFGTDGRGFVPMKVLRQDDRHHSPRVFMARNPDVGVIMDLTSQAPPYLTVDNTIPKYIKLSHESKKVPGRDYVDEFIRAANQYWEGNPGKLIGVHCHYGFNRTGFMVCCYLVERAGFTVQQAIDAFKASRPHGIKHQHFIDELHLRYEGSV